MARDRITTVRSTAVAYGTIDSPNFNSMSLPYYNFSDACVPPVINARAWIIMMKEKKLYFQFVHTVTVNNIW